MSGVTAPILPLVLTESLRFTSAVLAYEAIPICEKVRSVAFSQALVPLAFVFVSVGKDMDTVSLGPGTHPLADVRFSVGAFPDAIAVLDAIHPLSVVNFSVLPLIDTLSVSFPVLVTSIERVPIREHFKAATMAFVLEPFSFIYSSVLVNENTQAFSLSSMIELASINAVFVLLDAKVSPLAHFLVVKFIAYHFITLNCVTVILKVTVMLA